MLRKSQPVKHLRSGGIRSRPIPDGLGFYASTLFIHAQMWHSHKKYLRIAMEASEAKAKAILEDLGFRFNTNINNTDSQRKV